MLARPFEALSEVDGRQITVDNSPCTSHAVHVEAAFERMVGDPYRGPPHPDGFFIRPDTVTKATRRLAKQAGLTGVSLHTLRHSHGSQLLSAGVSLPVVSRRLGHSNAHVTATVYAHALLEDEIAAADIWAKAMKKATHADEPTSTKAGSDIDEAFALVDLDRSRPFVFQGYRLLHSCVSSLYSILEVLQAPDRAV